MLGPGLAIEPRAPQNCTRTYPPPGHWKVGHAGVTSPAGKSSINVRRLQPTARRLFLGPTKLDQVAPNGDAKGSAQAARLSPAGALLRVPRKGHPKLSLVSCPIAPFPAPSERKNEIPSDQHAQTGPASAGGRSGWSSGRRDRRRRPSCDPRRVATGHETAAPPRSVMMNSLRFSRSLRRLIGTSKARFC